MVTKETISHLAHLARVDVRDGETESLSKDLESILAYVSEIKDVSADVPEKEAGIDRNVFREDGEPHEPGIHTDALISQAPKREGDYVKVKKVL